MLKFFNPGEIDPRLITTLGVNVKDNDSAIGFFGTGLKYAIAASLRTGNKIEIHSGLRIFKFETETDSIRGKEFNFINMVETTVGGPAFTRLGFTTDLGKTWEPWMVYRELTTNAMDEYGSVDFVHTIEPPRADWTAIYVTGLDEVHAKASEIFLGAHQPIAETKDVQIFSHNPSMVYYRGVRVQKLGSPAAYSYNLLGYTELTEDRTLKSAWAVEGRIGRAVAECGNRALQTKVIMAPRQTFESQIEWSWVPEVPAFESLIADLFRSNSGTMVHALHERAEKYNRGLGPRELTPTEVEQKQLAKAIVFLKTIGVDLAKTNAKLVLAENLGKGILGMAKDETIYIAREAFQQGTARLAGTLLEEWAHIERGLRDYSPDFQNWLIDKIVSLGQEKNGEPL